MFTFLVCIVVIFIVFGSLIIWQYINDNSHTYEPPFQIPRPNMEDVHYALGSNTICGQYIMGYSDGTCVKHTMLKENITCSKCKLYVVSEKNV